jgi:protein SFI1
MPLLPCGIDPRLCLESLLLICCVKYHTCTNKSNVLLTGKCCSCSSRPERADVHFTAMSNFRPTKASPPSRLTSLADSLLNSTRSADLSRSSTVSIRELIGLTQEDVDLLDTIVARAGPSATTFPAVFTAYNAVLKERGLDPSEVVFYGKLLKLGTLKGANWGEKWRMVKIQQGYGSVPPSSQSKNAPSRTRRADLVPHHVDSLTLHSHENESTNINSDDENQADVDVPQYHMVNWPSRRAASPIYSDATSPSVGARNHPLLPPLSRSRPILPSGPQVWDTDTSVATEHPGGSLATPPSYRAAAHDSTRGKKEITHAAMKRPTPLASLTTARQLVAQARERKGSVRNEGDAWKKIKMLQDEKDAEAFRQDRLLERCWEVWREGFQWIIVSVFSLDSALGIQIINSRLTNKSVVLEIITSSDYAFIVGELAPLDPVNSLAGLLVWLMTEIFGSLSGDGGRKPRKGNKPDGAPRCAQK